MRPLILLVTLLLVSCHVLGGEPIEDEEDGGDGEDSGDDDDDEEDDDDDAEEVMTTEEPCNTACILLFQPVCAINNKLVLKTFSNSCFLGVFNCQNKEDFVAIANCSCIFEGVAITASTPAVPSKKKIKNEDEDDD